MFPIMMKRDEVLAFGGRRADWLLSEEEKTRAAKYINSRESDLYDKSNVFYGLAEARESIRRSKRALIVEGYLDVIALHQAGLTEAIACCGTALSDRHAERLRSFAGQVVTVYDGDNAGRQATRRAAEALLAKGLKVHTVILPEGHDPDTFVRKEGAERLMQLIERAPSAIDAALDEVKQTHPSPKSAEFIVDCVASIRPLLFAISDPMIRDLYVEGAAKRLEIDSRLLRRHLGQKGNESFAAPRPKAPLPEKKQNAPKPPSHEIALLAHVLDQGKSAFSQLEENDALSAFSHFGVKAVLEAARNAFQNHQTFDGSQALEVLRELNMGEETLASIRETLVSPIASQHPFNECLNALLQKDKEARLRGLRMRIQELEKTDPEAAARLAAELAPALVGRNTER